MRPLLFLCCCFMISSYQVSAQSGGSCVTPIGENAKCVSVFSCPVLYDAVTTTDPDVKKFLRASQCGYDDTPLVCCGTTASYPKPTIKPRVSTPQSLNHKNAYLLPDRTTCGYQAHQEKVLNGQATYINEFPWMALLRYRNGTGSEQFSCGGTLINNRYIVTAAHCVVGKIRQKVGVLKSVRLGEWNVDTDPDCINSFGFRLCSDKPVDLGIEATIPHPDYDDNSDNRYNDIALVRLNRQVKYSDYINPVCLPSSSAERSNPGDLLKVVGWGKTEALKFSPTKQKLDLPVVSLSQCKGTFRNYNVFVEDTQLCAGGIKDKDSCTGDSGGPLLNIAKNDSSQYYIEGIVSFGAPCGTEGFPGIYTRVSEYLNWILDNMKQ